MQLELPCLICHEPVALSRRRFLALVRAGRRPVCRRNGCHRYARERRGAAEDAGTARGSVVQAPTHVARVVLVGEQRPDNWPHGSLAKARVRRIVAGGCGDGVAGDG